MFLILGEGLSEFFIERIADGIGYFVSRYKVKTILYQGEVVLDKSLAGSDIYSDKILQMVLLYQSDQLAYLVRNLECIEGGVVRRGYSFVIEHHLFWVGYSHDLQVNISTLEDIGTSLENLFDKRSPYRTTAEDHQVDTFGDLEDFPMNHIDCFGKVFLMDHHADIASCGGVVDQ